jgi:hypothetical protein
MPLWEKAVKFGVNMQHLDGLLDIDFAAFQTAEIGPLMAAPLILQLLLLISRVCWLDDWTWPLGLVLIFAMNFLMAATCLLLVRRAAENVRTYALERLEEIKSSLENSGKDHVDVVAHGTLDDRRKVSLDKETYLKNLENVRKHIEDESRGAFAPWFQDPTYLGVFIPSSVSGIVSIVSFYWLN